MQVTNTTQPVMRHRAIRIDITDKLNDMDLGDLFDATHRTIENGGGLSWLQPPPRDILERYWRGVLMVPERHLLIARMDGIVCGAVQLAEPARYNEAQSFRAFIQCLFVAPGARRQGAGRRLLYTAEQLAAEMGYQTLHLDVASTQTAAISLFTSSNYHRWGTNTYYANEGQQIVSGHYYAKAIRPHLTIA